MKKFLLLALLLASRAIGVEFAGRSPVIDPDGTVTFFYVGTGKERSVSVIGEHRTESPYGLSWHKEGLPMRPVEGKPDVYSAQRKFEPDARVEYAFSVDGRTRLDELNPRRYFNGNLGGDASELLMPAYPLRPLPRELAPEQRGQVQELRLDWAVAPIRVYLPKGYTPRKRYPTAYVADGSAWIEHTRFVATADELIADGAIDPFIAVLMDPPEDRRNWYLFNREYLAYLERVIRHVDASYSTRAEARARFHFGSSAGGRASLFAALERPDLVLNVGLLSPSIIGSVAYFEPYFARAKRPHPKLRAWVSAGSYEPYILEDTKVLEKHLRAFDLRVGSRYTHEGHSFQNWRHRAHEMLRFFFGTSG